MENIRSQKSTQSQRTAKSTPTKSAQRRRGKKSTKGKSKEKLPLFISGGSIDYPFLTLVLVILTVGLVMMFSASYANAYYYHGDSFYFISRQLMFALAGIFIMIVASQSNYKWFEKMGGWLYLITLIILLMPFLFPKINGAHRWINLGFTTFQPSELAKFVIPVFFAKMMTIHKNKMDTFQYGIIIYVLYLIPIIGILFLQPHLSALAIIGIMAGIMILVAGFDLKKLVVSAVGAVGLLLFGLVISGQWDRAMGRFNVMMDPFADAQGSGFQTIQSLYAVGSGGLMGVGIGNSRQKFLYIPEPQNDFVFAVVCEELGFIGASVIILIFALLIWRGFTIALKSHDRFASLLVVGLTSQVAIQVIANIAVVTNLMPNTGISLPFFSYGGTSLLMLLGEMGVILSVSKATSRHQNNLIDKEQQADLEKLNLVKSRKRAGNNPRKGGESI